MTRDVNITETLLKVIERVLADAACSLGHAVRDFHHLDSHDRHIGDLCDTLSRAIQIVLDEAHQVR